MVSDAQRIRVIRALLGLQVQQFAALVGVTKTVVTNWEKGRNSPQRKFQKNLSELCQKERIMFLPSGMPCPAEDLMPAQENVTNG